MRSIRTAAALCPAPTPAGWITGIRREGMTVLALLVIVLLAAGCAPNVPQGYETREGDIVFQSLPHSPMVDMIEGATQSRCSHCGIVAKSDGRWVVIEAIGLVKETPLGEWIAHGRDGWFAAYRLDSAFSAQVPAVISEARRFLGRPYDIHYQFNDDSIYSSELVFKAIKAATGQSVGKIQRLADLNWRPYASYICTIEQEIPLDREMITPRALTEAPELKKVFERGP